MRKEFKLDKPVMEDGLRETVTLRTVARLIKESNEEFKGLRKDIKKLSKTITEMLDSLNQGVAQTKEGVRIADTSIQAIDKLASAVKEDATGQGS